MDLFDKILNEKLGEVENNEIQFVREQMEKRYGAYIEHCGCLQDDAQITDEEAEEAADKLYNDDLDGFFEQVGGRQKQYRIIKFAERNRKQRTGGAKLSQLKRAYAKRVKQIQKERETLKTLR